MGSYNPHPVTFNTFGINLQMLDKKEKRPKTAHDNKFFGTETRFDLKSTKSKKSLVPGPGNYEIVNAWDGKPDT